MASVVLNEKDEIMHLFVEVEQEEDGRWLSEVSDLPGVLAYGATRAEAIFGVQELAARVVAEQIEYGERVRNTQRELSRSKEDKIR